MFRPGYKEEEQGRLDRLREIDPEDFDEEENTRIQEELEEQGESDDEEGSESGGGEVQNKEGKISPLERRIVIGVALLVDGSQIVLNLFVVGVAVNRVVDIVFGIILLGYGGLRDLLNQRTMLSIGAAFVAEEIPILDAAPFWWLDAWYLFHAGDQSNTPVKLPGNIPGMDKLASYLPKRVPPLNNNGVRLPRK